MTKETRDLCLRGLSCLRSDDLERARMAFRNKTPSQMQEQWGQSGKTCAAILAEYEQHAAKIDAARKEVENT